jgi:hypothetical protein
LLCKLQYVFEILKCKMEITGVRVWLC